MSHRELLRVPLGGVLYSIGAVFHVLKQPGIWPGVFEAHELFHVLSAAAAVTHFSFIWDHVVRERGGSRSSVVFRPMGLRRLGTTPAARSRIS